MGCLEIKEGFVELCLHDHEFICRAIALLKIN